MKKFYVKKNELEIVLKLFSSFSTCKELDKLFDKILDSSRELTNCDAGTLYIKNDEDFLEFKLSRSYFLSNKFGEEGVNDLFKTFTLKIDENSIAGYCAKTKKMINIGDVKNLDKLVTFTYNDYWDKKYDYNTISMLTFPLINNQNELIGVLQLINAKDRKTGDIIPFSRKSEYLLSLIAMQSAMAIDNIQLTTRLHESHIETILKLGIASEYRDKETFNHIRRMSEYSSLLALKVKKSQKYAENMRLASMMHDIGKIGIPDAILLKPDVLTDQEKKQMQKHTIFGAMILKESQSDILQLAAKIALTHHERWDGAGYPLGLKGNSIPIEGRIVSIADVFDALSSKRIYKESIPIKNCINMLKSEKGKQFDPELVEIFIESLPEIDKIRELYKDTDESEPEIFTIGDIIVDLSSL